MILDINHDNLPITEEKVEGLLLGIDVGTTGAKAVLFTINGKLQGLGYKEYTIYHEHPGWAEQEPDDWWQAVCIAVKQALNSVSNGKEKVLGVSVSSQAPTMLPLSRDGKPVRPALIWMDRRSETEVAKLREIMGEGTIEKITGNRVDPYYVAPKLLWFKNHEPENFLKTSLFVQANGFINYKLTHQHTMDNVHASLLQLLDWKTNEWSDQLCWLCGVGPDKFPPIHLGYHIQGEITRDAADVTGLLPGTPVMTGTVDGAAAAIEAGIVIPGIAAEMTGTSTVLLMPNDKGVTETAFIAMPHAIPGLHMLLGAIAASGASLRWFRDQFGIAEMHEASKLDAYELLTIEASCAPVGSNGLIFLPYMMGERSPIWHTNARGVFFGLSLSSSRSDMIRSILEGTTFALKHNIEIAKKAGIIIDEIRSVGRGTKSKVWNQIKADVLGIPILLPQISIGAPFGDAILAGMGLNIYTDVKKTLDRMIKIKDRYEPDLDNNLIYREIYTIYRSIYESLYNDFDKAAKIRNLK